MNKRLIGIAVVLILAVVAVFAITTTPGNPTTTTSSQPLSSASSSSSSLTGSSAASSSSSSLSTNSTAAGRVSFYKSDGDWNFSVILGSSVVPKGEPIEANATLTDISGQDQLVYQAGPFINPVIYSKNGTQVWASDSFQIHSGANYTAGESTGPDLDNIPTLNLTVGQSYILSIWPYIEPVSGFPTGTYQLGRSLMINATISIGPTVDIVTSTATVTTQASTPTTTYALPTSNCYPGGELTVTATTTVGAQSTTTVTTTLTSTIYTQTITVTSCTYSEPTVTSTVTTTVTP
jgi:hypothetical protein